uniref:Zinc carboxypeptidase A 1 n=1 Tax=Heliothis virescens TaxID=7102 RepID=A0A2A4J213_HELVI
MNLTNFIFIFTILAVVSAVKKSYDGYSLYKIVPKDESEVNVLDEIKRKSLGEFWSDDFKVGFDTKVMVSPEKREEFVQYVTNENIEATVVISDVQAAIDRQLNPDIIRSSESYLSYSWSEYHDLNAIYKWLDELQENHPDIAKTVVMGQSVENRDIKGIIINYHPERENKRIGMLEGTLHAREWISAATVTWIIKEFLTNNDPEIRALAENFEWHIFPVVNPDGYSYTFTDNRMWRKNRSPESIKTCPEGTDNDMSHGVDLNRNFDVYWMTEGASNDSCTNTFAGPTAFSEPESRAIAQYVGTLNEEGEIIYYIAFHSYTQLIIIPYSHVYSEDALLSGNYADMYEIAIKGADALSKRFGTTYRVGLSANVMYTMSGTSFDWVKYAHNVPITYLLELRDLGEFGFLLPANQIVPTGLETMDALVEMDRNARKIGYYHASASGMFYSMTVVLLGVFVALFY